MPVEIETNCQALWDVLLSDKLNATHARWRDSILVYNIIDVCHVPGITNIADGVSRQYKGTPKGFGDGSEWTVSPDIDEVTGVVQDMFHVEVSPEAMALKEHFANEPMFLEVINALLELDHGTKLQERKRARHQASQYTIEDGWL